MKKGLKVFLSIVVILLILIVPIVSSYNNLVSLDQNVLNASSNIETQLQRRSDLIPNLVNVVKGYATHEEEIFIQVAEARSKLAGANNVSEQVNADAELSSALSRLLVIVEQYPELKANQNFSDLAIQLEGTENRIAILREDYNKVATSYNTKIRKFPTNIISSIFNFEKVDLYKAAPGSEEVPKVDFNS